MWASKNSQQSPNYILFCYFCKHEEIMSACSGGDTPQGHIRKKKGQYFKKRGKTINGKASRTRTKSDHQKNKMLTGAINNSACEQHHMFLSNKSASLPSTNLSLADSLIHLYFSPRDKHTGQIVGQKTEITASPTLET